MSGVSAFRDRHHRLLWTASQVGIVLLGVFVYFRIRGLTAARPEVAVAHARAIVSLEDRLGIDVEGALQAPVVASAKLSAVANWIYIYGHWPVIVAVMVWTVWRHRDVFLRLRDAMIVSGALGMAVFVTYPVAPPRLAGLGLVDTVTEQSHAYRILQPPQFVNQYAAMPSLHAGWDLLVGIAIFTAAGGLLLKAVGAILPVLMTLSVVVTANHYLLDVVAGIALVIIGYAVALWLDQRRRRPRAQAALAPAEPEPQPPSPPPSQHPRSDRAPVTSEGAS